MFKGLSYGTEAEVALEIGTAAGIVPLVTSMLETEIVNPTIIHSWLFGTANTVRSFYVPAAGDPVTAAAIEVAIVHANSAAFCLHRSTKS